MCGIVGYTGQNQASPILIDSLLRLEYRGYDSAGIATIESENNTNETHVKRSAGKIRNLQSVELWK